MGHRFFLLFIFGQWLISLFFIFLFQSFEIVILFLLVELKLVLWAMNLCQDEYNNASQSGPLIKKKCKENGSVRSIHFDRDLYHLICPFDAMNDDKFHRTFFLASQQTVQLKSFNLHCCACHRLIIAKSFTVSIFFTSKNKKHTP